MPYFRRFCELNIGSLFRRQQIQRMLSAQLLFHPFKNPKVSRKWFSGVLRIEFDYFTDGPQPNSNEINTSLLLLISELMCGQKGVPALRHDSVIGPLKGDRMTWEGEFELCPGNYVSLLIWSGDYSQSIPSRIRRHLFGPAFPTAAIDRMKQVVPQLQQLDERWKDGIVQELWSILNDNWNDGPPVSKDEFRSKLSLTGLEVDADGALRVRYNPSGLFTDHDVRADLNETFHVVSATLEG